MVIQWIIVGIFIIVGLWFLKLEHHTKKIKIILLAIIITIVYLSMMGIFSSEKVDLTSPRGVVNAVYVYFGWMGRTVTDLWDIGADTVQTVGNAIKVNDPREEDTVRKRLIGLEE